MYTLRESAIGHNNFESLLSVEQIDAKIQELISENAGLRSNSFIINHELMWFSRYPYIDVH